MADCELCVCGQRQSGGRPKLRLFFTDNNVIGEQYFAAILFQAGLRLHWVLADAAIKGAAQCKVTSRIRIDGSSEAKTLPGVGLRGR